MMTKNLPNLYLVAALAAVAALAWTMQKGNAEKLGEAAGGAVVDMSTGLLAGAALGVGDALGVPRTDATECARAKAAGRTWQAGLKCPAGEFLSYLWS